MLPALLLAPWVMEACTALMVLYIRFGPSIMALLTETPGAGAARSNMAAAARQWMGKYGSKLNAEQLSTVREVVSRTQAIDIYNRHAQNLLSTASTAVGPVQQALLVRFPDVLRPLASSQAGSMIIRHQLYFRQGTNGMWELKKGGVPLNIHFHPSWFQNDPGKFAAWLQRVTSAPGF